MEGEVKPLIEIEPGSAVAIPDEYKLEVGADTALFMGVDADYGSKEKVIPKLAAFRYNTLEHRAAHASAPAMPWMILRGNPEKEILDQARTRYSGDPMAAVDMNMQMTVGGDPEVFMARGDGRVFPAWEWLKGKDKKSESDGSVPVPPAYWDGFQAEFAAWSNSCIQSYSFGLQKGLRHLWMQARAKDPLAKFIPVSLIDAPIDILQTADEKYLTFGCAPSINVYDDRGEPALPPRAQIQRTAGGHIHAGLFRQPGHAMKHITYALDGILGVASVSMAEGIDHPDRRRTYGRAGEIRLPSHGLEYRVLSNFHLLHPALTHLVYEMFRVAVRLGARGMYSVVYTGSQEEVRRVINQSDVAGARKLIAANRKLFRALLEMTNLERKSLSIPLAMKTLEEGALVTIPSVMELEKNWELEKNPQAIGRGGYLSWGNYSQSVRYAGGVQ